MRPLSRTLGLALAALCLAACPARADDAPRFTAWVQYADDGTVEARATSADGKCPAASLDGQPVAMTQRSPASEAFPAVCALTPPAGAKSLVVGGRALPLPRPVNRIVMFGDTGCRLKGKKAQACNDPGAWPYATVARLAAARHPDLVVQLGDYYYRESPCPDAAKGCAPTPYGDHWSSWDADFFNPSEPLFAAAPWIMVRGNHEDCKRGGEGWGRLLSPNRASTACAKVEKPFAVDIGGLSLAVLDSNRANDLEAPPERVAEIDGEMKALQPLLAKGPAWMIQHHPVWSLAAAEDPLGLISVGLDRTLQVAAKQNDLSGVGLIVSGHVHHFAAYDFAAKRPAQLVIGSGGTIGSAKDSPKVGRDNITLDGVPAQSLSFYRWGYGLFERTGADWTLTFYDVADHAVARCLIHGRALTCGEVK